MEKLIANNKKARHDYFFEETYEAGIVLTGTEIKSVRAGGVNLRDSFAKVEKGEIEVQAAASSDDVRLTDSYTVTKNAWIDGRARAFWAEAKVR